MTSPPDAHAEEHDDLLHAHLAGDVPADDARLVERLECCGACRERLDELRSLTDLLERVGDEQRRSLTPSPSPTPGSERVGATLEALAQGRPPSRLRPLPGPSRRTTLWRVGLAAASVVAAGWIVKTLLPPAAEPRGDVMLGDADDQTLSPSGTVEAFDSFDWDGHPPEAVYFKLRVWREGTRDGGETILYRPSVQLPWTPEPEDLAILNDARAIEWELESYDVVGNPLRAHGAHARLQP